MWLGPAARRARAGLFALAVAVLLQASAARAQVFEFAIAPIEFNFVGLGVGAAPDYPGSDDYTWGVGPTFHYELGDYRYVELLGPTFFANVLDHPYLRLGPLLNYRFGRDDPDDSVVALLSDVNDSLELGLGFGVSFVNPVNERIRFSARLDVGGDVTGGHGGTLATLTMRYWHPLSRAFDFGFGVSSTYATQSYMNSFFGINQADAARSGLNAFDPSDGVRDIAFTPLLVLHLSREWHVGIGMRYQHLLGDAADSPVTDVRGSPDQFIAGIGFAYAW
jgi:outer membrane protein